MLKERTGVALDMSNVTPKPPTADVSITSFGSVMALTSARFASVSVKDTTSESTVVSSSPFDSVMPPVPAPDSRMWNFSGIMDEDSTTVSKVTFKTPVETSREAEENAVGGNVNLMSKADISSYSCTLPEKESATNILTPSVENATSCM